MNTSTNGYQNYCSTNIHQSYYSQEVCGEAYTPEKYNLLPSLLKNVLLHGKKVTKQNYYAHSHINTDIISSYQTTPNSQVVSHNPSHISSAEYLTSAPEISPECQQFFNNLQGQYQQQEYSEYCQNYPGHTVQSHSYALHIPGSSTISTQYEQNEPKQQAISNAQQESQINSSNRNNNNNNNIRRKNKNMGTSNLNNEQGGPFSSNVANYPWMQRTNANQGNGTEQKRTRQTYSRSQIFQLETEFHSTKYVSKRQRMDISKKTNLTERQVKIWFQNRRMKEKKDKSIAPINSSLTTAASTASKPITPKSNTQTMIHERQVSNPAQLEQVQLQSQQQFYEGRQNYFDNHQNVLTPHYFNNSITEDNNGYRNAIVKQTSLADFNTFNYSTTLENIGVQNS